MSPTRTTDATSLKGLTTPLSLKYHCALFAFACCLWPHVAWASGKICGPGMSCQWLLHGCLVLLLIGVGCLVALGLYTGKYTRRFALGFGVINLVIGERFWSQPVFDIFYNSKVPLLQMAVGVLCLALAILQIKRTKS